MKETPLQYIIYYSLFRKLVYIESVRYRGNLPCVDLRIVRNVVRRFCYESQRLSGCGYPLLILPEHHLYPTKIQNSTDQTPR
jgi:hypothetical protein